MLVYVLDETRSLVGTIGETLHSLEFTRQWRGTDTAKLVINRRRAHAAELTNGRYLYLPEEGDRLFYVEQMLTAEEAGLAKDLREVHCRGMEGPSAEERLVDPRPAAYDTQLGVPAETAMKHYLDAHAGPGAAVARRLPGLVIAADAGRGSGVNVEARFQKLADILREIGLATEMGWQFTFLPATKEYQFDVVPGVDRSASVFLDIAFDTLQKYEELYSLLDSKTAVLVAGQGEGVDRDLVDRHADGLEKTGFERREAFIDARDVPVGSTSVLNDRGDAALAELRAERRFEADVHAFGSFRYRTHWDLGDIVLLRNQELGLAEPVRVVSVTTKVAGATAFPSRSVELGRPMPTLRERVSPGVSSVSAKGTVDQPVTAGLVPSGVIVMWSGAIAAIPEGWLLCDGTNGTPDLRDRFIVGEGTTPGGSGGTISPTAALADHPSHSHSMQSHTHSMQSHTHNRNSHTHSHNGAAWATFAGSAGSNFAAVIDLNNWMASSGSGNTGAPSTASTGAPSTASTDGEAAQAHGVYKYLKLAFIMKA